MESGKPCMMRPEQQHGHTLAIPAWAQGTEATVQRLRRWRSEPRLALLLEKHHLRHSLASSNQPICQGQLRSPQSSGCKQKLRQKQHPHLLVVKIS